ncbi:hypothetical protein [Pontibacter cellulosilyticus]|uniref:Uncharacterized protein n=1 Tax=Pontibacter cellulosilyticus TaxID=1720253 RepID=A0A923N7E6_9BACT|nr:hypothetical protein [Pontibacter cellulosilyticus]MBC5993149.1 hypothetical protein [Pontibacter cellulosilyticus]
MKKTTQLFTIAALSVLGFTTANAQQVISGKTAKAMPTYIGEMTTYVGDGFGQHKAISPDDVDYSANAPIGNTFLTEDWNKGTIFFTLNRKLEDQQFQFDIEMNQFLLKGEEELKELSDARVVNGVNVMAFVMKSKLGGTRQFLNSLNSGYKVNGVPLMGFLEVIEDGKATLLRKYRIEVIKAGYNVALNAGNKQDKIVKKEAYYLKKKDSNDLVEISRNQKSNLAALGAQQDQVKAYMKENKLKFKPGKDLAKIVAYYNTL